MDWLRKLFGRENAPASTSRPKQQEEAVIIELNGISLAPSVYDRHSLDDLESLIVEALAELGEYDGHETGQASTKIYLYSHDAEKVFGAVEPVLIKAPLASGAIVTIRTGPPGSRSRQVQIPVV